jgi:valyl-tRNA synthetase
MGAIDTLYYCLNKMLYLLYPIAPFITKRILREMYALDLDLENFQKLKNMKANYL